MLTYDGWTSRATEPVTITANLMIMSGKCTPTSCKQGEYTRVITVLITTQRSGLTSKHADQLLLLKMNMQSTTIFIFYVPFMENFSLH